MHPFPFGRNNHEKIFIDNQFVLLSKSYQSMRKESLAGELQMRKTKLFCLSLVPHQAI
ncbi:hypothetical protein LEP1GSC202_3219 [Leptospira yanagawae serovar Saopaulo str. Sao Paulo = ATCC 700523]|uniref:Uncharacterized protein n=1 Tax=Leptospira yanagawae serovar Saopaulo str. Sao Paulo = ATCC 700523 TaxID=1249483 RepID=A0A5E8HEG6_9LEPT|nr:hypothetical protein LEP1GSC202_3219 [Leptospira yanagawae serovar Saopaulo str. Sao Paulo = ATCC 700523]